MFEKLATFAYSNRRRVLFVGVIGAVIAGVFGTSVSSHLSPYGADDPATQSVQATNRFQAATGRQLDPGVVALVSTGDVRSPAARQRVGSVAAELRAQPDVARVASFYTAHDPAMVARDGRSTFASNSLPRSLSAPAIIGPDPGRSSSHRRGGSAESIGEDHAPRPRRFSSEQVELLTPEDCVED